jgi:tRNA G26 N,N-dimethylase Trm1
MSPPPMERLLEAMGEIGRTSRTHFSPTGFKSDQSYARVRERYARLKDES